MEMGGPAMAQVRAADPRVLEREVSSNRTKRAGFRAHLGTDEERRENPHKATWLAPSSGNSPRNANDASAPKPMHRRTEPLEYDARAGVWRRLGPGMPSHVHSPRPSINAPKQAWAASSRNSITSSRAGASAYAAASQPSGKAHPALRRPELSNVLYETKAKVRGVSLVGGVSSGARVTFDLAHVAQPARGAASV